MRSGLSIERLIEAREKLESAPMIPDGVNYIWSRHDSLRIVVTGGKIVESEIIEEDAKGGGMGEWLKI